MTMQRLTATDYDPSASSRRSDRAAPLEHRNTFCIVNARSAPSANDKCVHRDKSIFWTTKHASVQRSFRCHKFYFLGKTMKRKIRPALGDVGLHNSRCRASQVISFEHLCSRHGRAPPSHNTGVFFRSRVILSSSLCRPCLKKSPLFLYTYSSHGSRLFFPLNGVQPSHPGRR